MQKTLLCFGIGYSAKWLAGKLRAQGWNIIGTTRDETRAKELRAENFEIHSLETLPEDAFARATHMLHSIPPGDADSVMKLHKDAIQNAKRLAWFGYLSTTGVYGDHAGAWVDETSETKPVTERQKRRHETENAFLNLRGVPTHVFRLAGIYGPTRSVIDDIREGTARRIYKEGQVFSRIHVEDIAHTLLASIEQPSAGNIYNVCDDEPCPAHEVVTYACDKMGVEPPPMIPVDEANLSEMGREFYSSNRRVSNRKIREKLGVKLLCPTYREGVNALIKEPEAANYAD